jgi:hypothetical protein
MGFTHYWKFNTDKSRRISMTKRKQILPIVWQIVSHHEAVLTGDGYGQVRIPVLLVPEPDAICFNGIGENPHETFLFPFTGEPQYFEYCKTEIP